VSRSVDDEWERDDWCDHGNAPGKCVTCRRDSWHDAIFWGLCLLVVIGLFGYVLFASAGPPTEREAASYRRARPWAQLTGEGRG
jgi:hypothetical protein